MKVRKNYKLWGLVFLFFVFVWFWRASTVSYYKAAAPVEVRPKVMEKSDPRVFEKLPDRGLPYPPPPPGPSSPMTTPKEPVDFLGWMIKIGGGLSAFKTLLDIIDKLKKRPQPIPVSGSAVIPMPEKGQQGTPGRR